MVAACAECIETVVSAIPGAAVAASVVRRFRSADGRLRLDFEKLSMILNPLTGEQIILNHLTHEARIMLPSISIPLAVPIPGVPGIPALPAPPALPPEPNLVALGTAIVDGLMVEGVRHVFAAVDGVLPAIASWEVWTNTKLQMPVFTQTIGSFGVRTCICKCAAIEPPASAFQIPASYSIVH